MMKKKFFAAILMAMALAAFSLAACDYSSVTPITPVADIPDAATVEVGGLFDFETAAVAKGDKVYLPKSVTITFGENENVEFTGTSFSPAKVGVYTITYTFDIDGETKAYTTAVTARDTTKPSILLSSAIPVRAEYNARLTLPTFTATDICDGSLTADVKVYENNADKTPIAVTDGEFTVDTYDGIVIEATATDAAGNTALDRYTVAVRGEREVDDVIIRLRIRVFAIAASYQKASVLVLVVLIADLATGLVRHQFYVVIRIMERDVLHMHPIVFIADKLHPAIFVSRGENEIPVVRVYDLIL